MSDTPKRNEAIAVDRYHLTAAYGCAVMEEHPDGDYVLYTDYVSDLSALQGEVSRLREVLAGIRDPIAAAPEHAFGVHYEGPDQLSWPIRDEILSGIDKALNLEPPTDGR